MPKMRPSPTKQEKVEYVKSQGQIRDHHCHWPSCDKLVPPAMWGCYSHWMKLPKHLRDKVWEEYRPGQEVAMTPSQKYMEVAMEIQQWIRGHFPCVACGSTGVSTSDKVCVPCHGTGVSK